MVEVERSWGSLLLAWAVLLVCLASMVWTAIGTARRQRLRGIWQRLGRRPARPKGAATADSATAQQEAEALIARARRSGTVVRREGNVLRPERFSRRNEGDPEPPPDDDKPRRPTLH